MSLLHELFGREKPVIGMVHFPPLPGSPLYDPKKTLADIRDQALRDAQILEKLGFDGMIFSNEGDRPYLRDVGKYTVAVMARLIEQIVSHVKLPFGVSVLADPIAAISVAEAVEAAFVRTFLCWVYVGDWGIVDPDAGSIQRLRASVRGKCKVFANVSGHTSPLGNRSIGDLTRGSVFFGLADAVCLAGSTAGMPVNEADIIEAKNNSDGRPVLVGTGVNAQNLSRMLSISDGIIVGTSIKKDGNTFNPIDELRAKEFIDEVKRIRGD
ncbi:MAG: BtpA/SgcQ family protein [Pseudothermotoga sp.]|nr:BtpA/SgcQ family protein [Pseudothermotoga sp.]